MATINLKNEYVQINIGDCNGKITLRLSIDNSTQSQDELVNAANVIGLLDITLDEAYKLIEAIRDCAKNSI